MPPCRRRGRPLVRSLAEGVGRTGDGKPPRAGGRLAVRPADEPALPPARPPRRLPREPRLRPHERRPSEAGWPGSIGYPPAADLPDPEPSPVRNDGPRSARRSRDRREPDPPPLARTRPIGGVGGSPGDSATAPRAA